MEVVAVAVVAVMVEVVMAMTDPPIKTRARGLVVERGGLTCVSNRSSPPPTSATTSAWTAWTRSRSSWR